MNKKVINQIKDIIMNKTLKLKYDFNKDDIPEIFKVCKEGDIYFNIELNLYQADVINYIYYLTYHKPYTKDISIILKEKLMSKFSLNDNDITIHDESDIDHVKLIIDLPTIFQDISIKITN